MSTHKRVKTNRVRQFLLAACLLVWNCAAVWSHGDENHDEKSDKDNSYTKQLLKNVGINQKQLNAQVAPDLIFRDENGKAVRLGDYFGDKPVMLLMISYACTQLCTAEAEALVYTLRDLNFSPGKEFTLLVASIDPEETVAMAKANKDAFMKKYERPAAAGGIHFLTAEQPAITELTSATGYRYVYDKVWKQWVHPSAIVMLTPEGKVSRYFLQLNYKPRDLRYGLIESSANRIGSPIDYFVLSCGLHYSEGKYSFAVTKLIRFVSVMTILLMAIGITASVRREKRIAPGVVDKSDPAALNSA